jgi:hypothetical protein
MVKFYCDSTEMKEAASVMDEAALDLELSRRNYCVTKLRKSDMGEQATNSLMEKLSEDPSILDGDLPTPRENPEPFEVKEFNQRNVVVIQTRIGGLEISDILAARLRSLFVTANPIELLTPHYLSEFSRAAFLLIYRYNYIDPGFKRQGFLGPAGFEAISEAFERRIDLEAFSSAINTTVPRYCSLFPDVEERFGSLGSFFDLQSLSGLNLIQVSPPRVGPITHHAVEHCGKLLRGTRPSEPKCIVLLTPLAWPDITKLIEDTGYLVWHNNTRRGHMIEYYDPVHNKPTPYAMPRVSVLSNVASPLSVHAQRTLHRFFSSH